MKLITFICLMLSLGNVLAFDLKGMVEKAAKDDKMQEQAKDLAKKGYDYFQGNKEEKKDDVANEAKSKEKPNNL